jgi:hypothetical protein
MVENKEKKDYYGVAWNYNKDTYRATGILAVANIKTHANALAAMFIHKLVKKQGDGWVIPLFYVRQTQNEEEFVIDISQSRSDGFGPCLPECRVDLLLYIDYNIWSIMNK